MKYIAALLFLLFSTTACAQVANSYGWNLQSDRVSVQGYDTVAYFSLPESSNAVKGKKEFSYEWEEATWFFSTKANLEKFKLEPKKYAPQYGGYCAYAAARNYLYAIDPNAWTIKDGKLYLNASKGLRTRWLKNIDEEIKKADKNWPSLKNTQ